MYKPFKYELYFYKIETVYPMKYFTQAGNYYYDGEPYKRIKESTHGWLESLEEVIIYLHDYQIELPHINTFDIADDLNQYEDGWYVNVYDRENKVVPFYYCKNRRWRRNSKEIGSAYQYTAQGFEYMNGLAHTRKNTHSNTERNKYHTFAQGMKQNEQLAYEIKEASEYLDTPPHWRRLNRPKSNDWYGARVSYRRSNDPRSWKTQKKKHQWE